MQNTQENVRREDSEEQREQTALDRVLERVAEDAEKAPSHYLRETIVPEGGE